MIKSGITPCITSQKPVGAERLTPAERTRDFSDTPYNQILVIDM